MSVRFPCSTSSAGALRTWVIAVGVVLGLQGCASLERRGAVPPGMTEQAVALDGPGVRYWVETDIVSMARDADEALRRERAALLAQGRPADPMPPAHFLAVSGGGDAGAFGAGLLVGWTALGTRPSFKVVTGISTGGLIAPFAFLGPAYDHALRHVYTSVGPDDIYKPRSFAAALTSDGMADNRPLWNLIAKYVNPGFLAEVAAEYAKGRFLLIGTTNIDARRPVIWNMGAIASSKDPRALNLFRDIMLASAAIPGAFSPVMIDVDAGGVAYQEMHVDGGAVAQVFLYPPQLSDAMGATSQRLAGRARHAWIIRNSKIGPDWARTERRTVDIAGRAIAALLQSSGIGDLYRIFATTQKDGVDFNLAYIGNDFSEPHAREFDTPYMRKLFDYGYGLGSKGYPWLKSPPGYSASPSR